MNEQHMQEFRMENMKCSGVIAERHICALDLLRHEFPNFDKERSKNSSFQKAAAAVRAVRYQMALARFQLL
jgi:hypothetical protein